jgi:dTMP kinase
VFASIEGIDYVGKTTQCNLIRENFTKEGIQVDLVSDPSQQAPWGRFKLFFENEDAIHKVSEAFLLLSARLDNYQRRILPTLARHGNVLADRYSDSWLAYQSVRLAEYLGGIRSALSFLVEIQNQLVARALIQLPDLTILFIDDPNDLRSRCATRGRFSKYDQLDFQQTVQTQFIQIAKIYPDRIAVVTTTGKNIEEVNSIVDRLLRTRLQAFLSKNSG